MYSLMTRLNKALIIIMYKTKMQEYVQKGPDINMFYVDVAMQKNNDLHCLKVRHLTKCYE